MSVTTMKTPGVYIQELDAFGNAVVPVPTAVPAFIGYTGQTSYNGKDIVNKAVKVTSLAEFVTIFGGKPPQIQFKVTNLITAIKETAKTAEEDETAAEAATGADKTAAEAKAKASKAAAEAAANAIPDFSIEGVGYTLETTTVNYRLFNAIRFFYENGGGTCYIISIGGYDYSATGLTSTKPFEDALTILEKETEPTMIVVPDAVELMDPTETKLNKKYALCYTLQGEMINHCGSLQNRIALIDIPGGYSEPLVGETSIEGFRNSVEPTLPKSNSYAAAYYPWLHTTVNQLPDISFKNIAKESHKTVMGMLNSEFPPKKDPKTKQEITSPFKSYITALFSLEPKGDPIDPKDSVEKYDSTTGEIVDAIGTAATSVGVLKEIQAEVKTASTNVTAAEKALTAANKAIADLKPATKPTEDQLNAVTKAKVDLKKAQEDKTTAKEKLALINTLSEVKTKITDIKTKTASAVTTINANDTTPATAITTASEAKKSLIDAIDTAESAGISEAKLKDWLLVASTPIKGATTITPEKSDSVLKNLSGSYKMLLKHILEKLNLMPASAAMAGIYTVVDNNEGVWVAPANVGIQGVVAPSINVDHKAQEDLNVPLDGKSICTIRSFPGKGVLVWGARTLDGNSNDWRYINVRRTLIYIEQSVKEAASAFVFAPNDASTWVSVKSMISNFLIGLWNQGGLVGPKPADAFSVTVGLGSTMTSEDILEGRMIVAVKVAVSHPAEFIEITFQQEMQKG